MNTFMTMSKVLFQIGRESSRKRSQTINAFLNDEQLSWDDDNGRFLTSYAEKATKGLMWYMYSLDLQPKDILRLSVVTFLTNIGKDEDLTFDSVFCASPDEDHDPEEISIPRVGMKGYPLVKGRITEIATVTESDKRKQDIEDFINEGF